MLSVSSKQQARTRDWLAAYRARKRRNIRLRAVAETVACWLLGAWTVFVWAYLWRLAN